MAPPDRPSADLHPTEPDPQRLVALRQRGLLLRTGPFAYRLRSDVPAVIAGIGALYGAYPPAPTDGFVDFDVDVRLSGGLRRFVRRQARFRFDGSQSFEPLPAEQGFALLEWAMNWCVSSHVNHHLLIHSAVVERGGRALVLPAPPGSGKSTLCAALVQRGWRLLSDEIAVVPLRAEGVLPLVRPVSLKNRSIDIIAAFEPTARFSRPAHGTSKGTVAHMMAPPAHVARMDEPAPPAWVVFPRWRDGAAVSLSPRSRADTLVQLARNSFNAATLGREGFERLAQLVDRCECFDFEYSRLDDAIACFESLAGGGA
jgi:HprK-related kinase A